MRQSNIFLDQFERITSVNCCVSVNRMKLQLKMY